jgi:hypothetical protein
MDTFVLSLRDIIQLQDHIALEANDLMVVAIVRGHITLHRTIPIVVLPAVHSPELSASVATPPPPLALTTPATAVAPSAVLPVQKQHPLPTPPHLPPPTQIAPAVAR